MSDFHIIVISVIMFISSFVFVYLSNDAHTRHLQQECSDVNKQNKPECIKLREKIGRI